MSKKETISDIQNYQKQQYIQRLDDEIERLRDGMVSIVRCAPLENKDITMTMREGYQIQCHTHSIVRSVKNLMQLTEELRQVYLLNDIEYIYEKNLERVNNQDHKDMVSCLLEQVNVTINEMEINYNI